MHRIFFQLLLLLLPTQLGYHFWPEWAGVLGRRVDYLAPTVYLTDILLFVTLLCWGMESLNRIRKYELGIRRIDEILTSIVIHNSKFVILFIIVAIVNIGIAQNHYVAIYKWIKVCEFVLLGWYIVRTKPTLSSIVAPLSAGVLYSSIIAIAQFASQHSVGGLLWWLGERTFAVDTPGIARFDLCQVSRVMCQEVLRPYGTFPHPNVLGGFFAAVIPLIISNIQYPISNQTKKFLTFKMITIVAGVIALLLTFSRSAVVVGIVAIALTIARIRNYARPERGRRELRIMNGKRVIITVVIALFVILPTSYFLLHNSTEESVVVRQQLNTAAITIWQSSPLFGVGLGNFLVRLPDALPIRTIYFLQPVHNIYLLLLSEVGIVGVGVIVFLIVYWSKYELGIRNYGKRNGVEIFVIRNSLFVILILGMVDHYPLTLQQGQLLLTIIIGMNLREVREVKK